MLPCHKMVLNHTHRAFKVKKYQMWIFPFNMEILKPVKVYPNDARKTWICRLPQQLEEWGKAKQLILMMMILIILIDTNWGFLKFYPVSVPTADIQRGLKARTLLRAHTQLWSRQVQTIRQQSNRCWIISHTLAYFPFCAPLFPPVVLLPTLLSQGRHGR